MIGKAVFFSLALLCLPGCALRSSIERDGLRAADGLSAEYPADADRLAREAAEELSRRYAPARTGLAVLVVPGQFGQSLEQGLRAKGFAVATDADAPGVRVGSVADVIRDELAPAGYVEICTSDGQRFSLVRRLKGDSLPAPLVAKSDPVVDAPFVMPEPISSVQATPLAETSVPTVGSVLTPKKEEATPASFTPAVLLPKAVLTVLPYNWRYTIPDTDRRQVKVSMPKNIPWREAIGTMAKESGCEARFDESARRVTLVATRSVPVSDVPAVASSPITPSSPISALHPASLPEVAPAPASPVVTAALQNAKQTAPEISPSVTSPEPMAALTAPLAPEIAPETPSAPETPTLPEGAWTLEPGSLYAQIGRWADEAGYQLVWKADKDLTMESAAVFRGTFMDAVKKLFAGLTKSGHGLRVTFYQSNNVMEVRGE